MGLKTGDIVKGRYEIIDLLGEGCAKVYLVLDNDDNLKTYALKVVDKRKFKKNRHLKRDLDQETRIHRSLPDHPNILRFCQHMEDNNYYYSLLEFITPGELYDLLYEDKFYDSSEESSDWTSGESESESEGMVAFTEDEARDYVYQMVQALKVLRSMGICHRDVKTQNMLLNERGVLKLCDFGFATDRKPKNIVGTTKYTSPEMNNMKVDSYNYKTDVWSLGICLYEFLYGEKPFSGTTDRSIERKILRGRFTFPESPKISDGAKDLIRRMLTKDPRRRVGYGEIEQHVWLRPKFSYYAGFEYEDEVPPF